MEREMTDQEARELEVRFGLLARGNRAQQALARAAEETYRTMEHSRERALVLTSLQEAGFWAGEGERISAGVA